MARGKSKSQLSFEKGPLLVEQDIVNMDDPLVVFAVSWVTIHRIPGQKGCVPMEKMNETNKAVHLPHHLIPTTSEVVRMYERGGKIQVFCYDPIVQFQDLLDSREHMFYSKKPIF
ncbi:hypothetical protein QZH41_012636 [Actinostola sp. cb2023]|nr:hypothetical protein QZH41_012636 [Actinostola sp. cb2023]